MQEHENRQESVKIWTGFDGFCCDVIATGNKILIEHLRNFCVEVVAFDASIKGAIKAHEPAGEEEEGVVKTVKPRSPEEEAAFVKEAIASHTNAPLLCQRLIEARSTFRRSAKRHPQCPTLPFVMTLIVEGKSDDLVLAVMEMGRMAERVVLGSGRVPLHKTFKVEEWLKKYAGASTPAIPKGSAHPIALRPPPLASGVHRDVAAAAQ